MSKDIITGVYGITGSLDQYKINPRTEYVEQVCPVTLPVGKAGQIATANGWTSCTPTGVYTPPVTGTYVTSYMWSDESGAVPFNPEGCSHNWKQYNGFTETYKFCEKCDIKDRT